MNEEMDSRERAQSRAISRAPRSAAAARRLARRAEAEGLVDVAYADVDTPVGNLVVASTRRGLVRVSLRTRAGRDRCWRSWPRTSRPRVLESPGRLDASAASWTSTSRAAATSSTCTLDWQLSRGFSTAGPRAHRRIPFGEVSTYREMAAAAGSPRGARAAGNALGGNPIPIVVPCHRVLHSGGGIGGYGGGLDRKRFLLRLEGAMKS